MKVNERRSCTVDFSQAAKATVELLPTGDVPEDTWVGLRNIQIESLASMMPRGGGRDVARAKRILGIGEGGGWRRYIESRRDPNSQVGQRGWNDRQRFDDPLAAIIRCGGALAGAVITQNNVSSRTGLGLEYGLKGMVPQLKYVHVREGFVHPDLVPSSSSWLPSTTVSGLVIGALSHSLSVRNPLQRVTMYVRHDSERVVDPADEDVVRLADVLGLEPTTSQLKHDIPGYPRDTIQLRMEGGVGVAQQRILALPGARAAIDSMLLAA